MKQIYNYEIACLQTRAKMVSLDDKQRDIDIRDNISRICEMTDYITAFGNSDVKLIVLPEYSINAAQTNTGQQFSHGLRSFTPIRFNQESQGLCESGTGTRVRRFATLNRKSRKYRGRHSDLEALHYV